MANQLYTFNNKLFKQIAVETLRGPRPFQYWNRKIANGNSVRNRNRSSTQTRNRSGINSNWTALNRTQWPPANCMARSFVPVPFSIWSIQTQRGKWQTLPCFWFLVFGEGGFSAVGAWQSGCTVSLVNYVVNLDRVCGNQMLRVLCQLYFGDIWLHRKVPNPKWPVFGLETLFRDCFGFFLEALSFCYLSINLVELRNH